MQKTTSMGTEEQNTELLFQGNLSKYTNGSWHKCFLKVTRLSLIFFRNKTMEKKISLKEIQKVIKINDHTFKIILQSTHGRQKLSLLRTENNIICNHWVDAIRKATKNDKTMYNISFKTDETLGFGFRDMLVTSIYSGTQAKRLGVRIGWAIEC